MKVYEMTIADIASEIFDKGEDFAEKIFNDIDGLEKNKLLEINKLKQQLAEKDTRIAELEDKDWYEACIKQLEEQNDRLIDKIEEKDKEIEELKTKQKLTFIHSKEDYFQRCNFLEEENIKLQFAQKQLAITELEKVKIMTEWKFNSIVDAVEYIDNRIKELKGE